jgi:hypothetical protein
MFILTVPELEQLLALRHEAIATRRTDCPTEPEDSYFAKIDEAAARYSVSDRDIMRDLNLREQGYYHEAERRAGVCPRWRD